MTKIIYVDPNKCIGCNTCPLLDPETFEIDVTTYKSKIKKQPADVNSETIKNAIISCPVNAISIIEK